MVYIGGYCSYASIWYLLHAAVTMIDTLTSASFFTKSCWFLHNSYGSTHILQRREEYLDLTNSSRKQLNWFTPICTSDEELGLLPTTPFMILVKLSTSTSNVIVVACMSGSDSRNDSNVSYHHNVMSCDITWCHIVM